MKIKAVHITRSDLPKIDKDWKFALRADPVVHGWVLAIEDEDGLISATATARRRAAGCC